MIFLVVAPLPPVLQQVPLPGVGSVGSSVLAALPQVSHENTQLLSQELGVTILEVRSPTMQYVSSVGISNVGGVGAHESPHSLAH